MRSYLYIEKLFQNILKGSKTIKGRVHFAPHLGSELNSDNLNHVLTETLGKDSHKKQYPLGIIMPPAILSNSLDNSIQLSGPEDSPVIFGTESEKRIFNIDIAFLDTTFYSSGDDTANEPKNTIKDINKDTNTSKHRIVEDWYDMDVVARDFIRALNGTIERYDLQRFITIYESDEDSTPERITPISTVGTDRVSGVYLQFRVLMYEGCDINDYTAESFKAITPPDINQKIHEH